MPCAPKGWLCGSAPGQEARVCPQVRWAACGPGTRTGLEELSAGGSHRPGLSFIGGHFLLEFIFF